LNAQSESLRELAEELLKVINGENDSFYPVDDDYSPDNEKKAGVFYEDDNE
jgi:hypothetical protein